MSKHCFLRRHPGEGTPMILAIVLVLLMLFCTVAEFSRVWIIAQGVKEAAQQAVISTINDNYDDVYHAVREGYAAGWFPEGDGEWFESIDAGDIYGIRTAQADGMRAWIPAMCTVSWHQRLDWRTPAADIRRSQTEMWNIPSLA